MHSVKITFTTKCHCGCKKMTKSITGQYLIHVCVKIRNPLTAGAAYIRVFIFYNRIKFNLLNMVKIKCDINQQYLKTVDLNFVKS